MLHHSITSYKIHTIRLYVLNVLNMHVNFHANRMLFTILSINSFFMHYFKLQKLEFKQLIDNMIINFNHREILQAW